MKKLNAEELTKFLQEVCTAPSEIGADEIKLRTAFEPANGGYVLKIVSSRRDYAKEVRHTLALFGLITFRPIVAIWVGISDTQEVTTAKIKEVRRIVGGKGVTSVPVFGSYDKLDAEQWEQLRTNWNKATDEYIIEQKNVSPNRATNTKTGGEFAQSRINPEDCLLTVAIGIDDTTRILRGKV